VKQRGFLQNVQRGVRERAHAPRVPPAVLARSCESKREELLRTLTRRCVAAPTFGQLAPVDLSPSCCQKSQMPVGLRGFGFLVESKITWNLGSMRARGQPWSVAN
jgi:hypothetical protein